MAAQDFPDSYAVSVGSLAKDVARSCPLPFSNWRCQWRSVDGVTLGTRRSPGRHHRRAHGSLRGRSAPHHGLGWLEQVNVVSAVCCRCPARHPGERPCSGLRPGEDEPGGGFAPELVLRRGSRPSSWWRFACVVRWPSVRPRGVGSESGRRCRWRRARPWPRPACSGSGPTTRRSVRGERHRAGG